MLFAIDIGFNFTVWCWVVGCFGVFNIILTQKVIKKLNSNTKINGGGSHFPISTKINNSLAIFATKILWILRRHKTQGVINREK